MLDIAADATRDFRIVYLNGPRQSGKTTLCRLLAERFGGTYLTFDEDETLAAAVADPLGFVRGFDPPVFIDEVQRAGDPIIRAIKLEVDRDPKSGRFVLTGSSRFLTVPTISETLAGRVRLLDLWPLAHRELVAQPGTLIDALFEGPARLRALRPQAVERRDVFELVCAGGFPEAIRISTARKRADWHVDYVRTVVAREAAELVHVRDASDLELLVALLAARTAQVLDLTDIARSAERPVSTVREHLALLETVYLVTRLRAWSTNLTSKVTKRPKAYVVDSGVCASLLGVDAAALTVPTSASAGALLESFVVGELVREATWARTPVSLAHFRDRSGAEVDVILESRDGRVVGIEVKAGRSLRGSDSSGLKLLRDRLGERFVVGVVLHLGERPMPIADRLVALPVSALWTRTGSSRA